MKNIGILKLLTFLFIFVVVVFMIVFLVIVPSIKELKATKIRYYKVYNSYLYATKEQKAKEYELKNLKYNNLKIIRAFDNRFNGKEFMKFSKKYFKQVSLSKDKNETYKKDFTIYNFHTVSKISDPTVFYKFLNDINRYDNIIEADFPIKMQAQNGDINTTFTLKVFRLKSLR